MNLGDAGQLDACLRAAQARSKDRAEETAFVFWQKDRACYGWDWSVPDCCEVVARYLDGEEVHE